MNVEYWNNIRKEYWRQNSIEFNIKRKLVRFNKKSKKLKKQYRLANLLWNDPVINGLMLSDGHLTKKNGIGNSRFQIDQVTRSEQFIYTISKYFTEVGIEHYIYSKSGVISLYSKMEKFWGLFRSRWYYNGKKTVPKDLVLSDKCIANWFMGDGYCSWEGNGNSYSSVGFCTNTFTFDEVNNLINLFKLLGYNGLRIDTIYRREPHEYKIIIGWKNEVIRFFEMINPYVVDCFRYKIKMPIGGKIGRF